MNEPKKQRRNNRFTRSKRREQAGQQAKPKKKAAPRKTWLVLLPKHTPALQLMLEDIGSPDVDEIASTFGVSRSTAYRWLKQDKAPRATMLALFYATQWGRCDVHARAHNDAVFQAQIARHLLERLDAAERQLARLGQIGEFGSANDPAEGVPTASMSPLATGAADQGCLHEAGSTPLSIRGEIARAAAMEIKEQPEETARLTRAN